MNKEKININEVNIELLKVLSSNLQYLHITLIINAIVIALLFKNIADSTILYAWVATFIIIFSFNYFMKKQFVNFQNKFTVNTYTQIFELPVYLGNIIFSLGIIAIFPNNLPFYQTFLSMTIASVASVAVMSLSANRILIINYLIILILPLISMFSFEGSNISSLIVLLYSLFLIVLIIFSKKYNKNIVSLIYSKIMVSESKKKMIQSKGDFATIFETAPVGIVTYNKNLIITASNKTFITMSMLNKNSLIGLDLNSYLDPDILNIFSNINRKNNYEGRYYHKVLKKEVWVTVQTAPMYGTDGNISGGMALVNDITKRVHDEKILIQRAFYDDLTNITNRVTFNDRLEVQLSFLQRHKRFGAILFIDLDNFKTINDTLGHHIGDKVLKEFTQRIITIIRKEDTFARFGGDEFVIMLANISHNNGKVIPIVSQFSNKLHNLVKTPFNIEDNILQITLSIGIATIGLENQNKNDALKHADIAMYEAKQAGRNCTKFFLESMSKKVQDELTLTNDLHNAIEENQFIMYYQAIINAKNNTIESCEALVRWNHPTKGLIYPDYFIPFAEKHGLLISIGYIIIEQVYKQYNKWNKLKEMSLKDIAINISPKQFNENSFNKKLIELTNKHQINPKHIKLELTESVMVNNIENTISKIHELKEYGFSFSMDDFGTGYSSLSYLKNLPFDYLKIDQSFIKNILNDKNDVNLVKTILSISEQFGFLVIAEGVETQEHIDYIKTLNCDFYQGYSSSKPLVADEFIKLL